MTRQPKSMVPKVRFKGFTDEWEQRKSKELFINISDKHHPELPVLSATQDNGMVYRQDLDIDIKYDEESLDNYKKVSPSDFVISLRSFQGGFEMSDKLGITSPAYTIFNFKSPNNQYPVFWKFLFKRYDFIESLKRVTFGIRDGKAISFKQFGDTKPSFPQLKEQQLIADILSKLDKTITLHEEKQRQLERLKKALLQKMFADKKHPKPELRFKSFHDNWINHKAGDFMIERNQKATIDDDFPLKAFIANKGVADKGERYDRSAITNDASNKMYKRTLFNDFIYSSNNLETGSIGLNKYGNASISPVYSIFYFKNKESADFFGRILVRKEFINSMIRYRQGVIYGQWRIKEKDFLNISISVPSLEEQEKIGSLLDKLDETINVNSKLLNQLKVLKKSLLQNMFI